MLLGLFSSGLHGHLFLYTSVAGVQLRSGRWVSSLVYADDLVLLSSSASGQQLLHKSGRLSQALQRLAQNSVGASAPRRPALGKIQILCERSFPVMRHIFDACVAGSVLWFRDLGPSCSRVLLPDIKDIVIPATAFRKWAEKPWVHQSWNQVIGLMHCLSSMPEDSVHVIILGDNLADAQETPHMS